MLNANISTNSCLIVKPGSQGAHSWPWWLLCDCAELQVCRKKAGGGLLGFVVLPLDTPVTVIVPKLSPKIDDTSLDCSTAARAL